MSMDNQQETLDMFDALIAEVSQRKATAKSDDQWYFWEGYVAALHDLRAGVNGELRPTEHIERGVCETCKTPIEKRSGIWQHSATRLIACAGTAGAHAYPRA